MPRKSDRRFSLKKKKKNTHKRDTPYTVNSLRNQNISDLKHDNVNTETVDVLKWKFNHTNCSRSKMLRPWLRFEFLTQTGKHFIFKYASYLLMWCIRLPRCCTGRPRCCIPAAWHRWCWVPGGSSQLQGRLHSTACVRSGREGVGVTRPNGRVKNSRRVLEKNERVYSVNNKYIYSWFWWFLHYMRKHWGNLIVVLFISSVHLSFCPHLFKCHLILIRLVKQHTATQQTDPKLHTTVLSRKLVHCMN